MSIVIIKNKHGYIAEIRSEKLNISLSGSTKESIYKQIEELVSE